MFTLPLFSYYNRDEVQTWSCLMVLVSCIVEDPDLSNSLISESPDYPINTFVIAFIENVNQMTLKGV